MIHADGKGGLYEGWIIPTEVAFLAMDCLVADALNILYAGIRRPCDHTLAAQLAKDSPASYLMIYFEIFKRRMQ